MLSSPMFELYLHVYGPLSIISWRARISHLRALLNMFTGGSSKFMHRMHAGPDSTPEIS